MPKVVHFEINADQPERAIEFYENVFGWQMRKWDGPQDYWLISTGDDEFSGIDGGLIKRTDPKASTINTIDVPSVDDFIEKITRFGGKVITPKAAIPGVGYFAYCQDTEGNTFGIIDDNPQAT